MSFRPHWINSNYFLIRINKEAQKAKREKLTESGLIMPFTSAFMTNNMQYGEIVMIGSKAEKHLPQAREGDDLIISHFIEGSLQDIANNDEYAIESDDVYNYYMVPLMEAYAVAKEDGNIFVSPYVIFAEPDETEVTEEVVFNGTLFTYNNFRHSATQWQNKITELNETLKGMQYYDGTDNHKKAIAIQEEMGALSDELRKPRLAMFRPLYVNEQFNRDCGRKITYEDVLYHTVYGSQSIELQSYELTYKGRKFLKLNPDSVVMVGKHGEPISFEETQLVVNEGLLQERTPQ